MQSEDDISETLLKQRSENLSSIGNLSGDVKHPEQRFFLKILIFQEPGAFIQSPRCRGQLVAREAHAHDLDIQNTEEPWGLGCQVPITALKLLVDLSEILSTLLPSMLSYVVLP